MLRSWTQPDQPTSLEAQASLLAAGVDCTELVPLRPWLLLHPQIPKPLHTVCPRNVLGATWWNEQRKWAYKRRNYTCMACGVPKTRAAVHKWLEAHEMYHIDYAAGRMRLLEIVALCHLCHNHIHQGRLEMLLCKGQTTQDFIDRVRWHGQQVLSTLGEPMTPAKYPFVTDVPERMAPWEDWRLDLNGVLYPPYFKTYEDWLNHNWDAGAP